MEYTAIYATGALAALIAIWGVVSQRLISKRKATIEYLSYLENDREYIEAKDAFARIANSEEGFLPFAKKGMGSDPDARALQTIFNNYELISIGIQRGVLDYRIFKLFGRKTAIYRWDECYSFIVELRKTTNAPALYSEYEQLVAWLKGTKPQKRGKFWSSIF